MSEFLIADPRSGQAIGISFENFVTLVKGASITSLADADGFLELGLSEALMLRIEASGEAGQLRVMVFSTLNRGEATPFRIRLVQEGEEPTAALVEKRLRQFRQVYAIHVLALTNRADEIAVHLTEDADSDLEDLLKPKDRLYLQAANAGSFWVTILGKTKTAQGALKATISLLYPQGRDLFLRRMRADTELKELDVIAKKDKIAADRIKGFLVMIEQLNKIKDPLGREIAKQALISTLAVWSRSCGVAEGVGNSFAHCRSKFPQV